MPRKSSTSRKQPRTIDERKKALSRLREKHRGQMINVAYESLQKRIPYLRPEERQQIPKIKTLRLATQYINHLSQLLKENNSMAQNPLTHSDFRSAVASEMRLRNSYRERAMEQEIDQETAQRILAREEQKRRDYYLDKSTESSYCSLSASPAVSTGSYEVDKEYQDDYSLFYCDFEGFSAKS